MKSEELEPMNLPAMKVYLRAVLKDPWFAELLATDFAALESLTSEPNGWDWADYDGGRVIDRLWLWAATPSAQARLGRVCHLRALAWEAALEPFATAQATPPFKY